MTTQSKRTVQNLVCASEPTLWQVEKNCRHQQIDGSTKKTTHSHVTIHKAQHDDEAYHARVCASHSCVNITLLYSSIQSETKTQTQRQQNDSDDSSTVVFVYNILHDARRAGALSGEYTHSRTHMLLVRASQIKLNAGCSLAV